MYYDWDYHYVEINDITGLSQAEKNQFQESLTFIRTKIFDASVNDPLPSHLISTMILNRTQDSKRWVIEFACALKNYLKLDNCENILGKIKNKDNFRDCLLEICIGDAFSRGNFLLQCHPSIVNINNKIKNPDFRLTNNKNEKYIVELKHMTSSDQSRKVSEYMDIVGEKMHELMKPFSDCKISGRFLIHTNVKTTNTILSNLSNLLESVKINGFGVLEEKRGDVTIFECAAASMDNISKLNDWDESKGLFTQPSNTIRSYDIYEDKLQRLNRAIIDKQNQLATDSPNMLIIRSQLLTSKVNNLAALKHMIVQLTEIISNYQLINYFVLIDGYIATYGEDMKLDQLKDSVFVYHHNGQFHRPLLIIKNIDSKIEGTNMTIENLLSLLENSRYLLI